MVGVGGGIACYKALELIRLLRKSGATVRPAPTKSALAFVQPMMFEAIAGTPPVTDVLEVENGQIHHIEEAYACDAIVVAPATCNLMARMVGGFADETLLATILASRAPLLVSPAMESHMWLHEATQANVEQLAKRGAIIIPPVTGPLASGREGPGRLPPPEVIFEYIVSALTPKDLDGQRILITAGPTIEDIDPIRYISNRSSGKMGLSLARVAAERGAEVQLILGPVHEALPSNPEIHITHTRNAHDMHKAVMKHAGKASIAIMCAAVADFTPSEVSTHKIKKIDADKLAIELKRTTDILAELGDLTTKPFLVGFAAESQNLHENAITKLQAKHCDMLCANDIAASTGGFASDENQITIYKQDGSQKALDVLPKEQVANVILNEIRDALSSL